MKNNKIHFRCDGGPAIGLGHLTRSLALAQMLDSLFEIHFHCIEAPESFVAELEKLNYTFHLIKFENEFIESIAQGDITVIDHYGIGIESHQKIRAKGALVVCIDDLHDKAFDADLIINHAPGVKTTDYQAQPYTQFALGPQYALLRPEFLEAARSHSERKPNRNLLICFGGADFNNLSCRALEALTKNDFFEEIHVITGSAYSFKHNLVELQKQDNRIHWHENQSATQMLRHMQHCFYALAPASSIAYELLAAGCTWLGGYYVDNQRNIYEGFKKMYCLIDLGDLNKELSLKLNKHFYLNITSINLSTIIDGRSQIRMLKIFFNKKLLVLRKANFNDAELLFKWANEAEVRKNAINQKNIEWEEHKTWLQSKLSSNSTDIYILEFDNRALGQIRLDFDENSWQIDYSLDSKFRGLGLGKFMIELIKNYSNKYNNIIALVKPENKASAKVFLDTGFLQKGEITINNLKLIKFEFSA